MRRRLILSVFLLISLSIIPTVSSQSDKSFEKTEPEENKKSPNLSELPTNIEIDDSEHYSTKWLSWDLRIADAVIYLDVKKLKIVDKLGENDCEKNTGNGYCLYLLTGDVKEVFKGDIKTQAFEFYTTADATYPKQNFYGQQIVFLIRGEDEKTKKQTFGTIENSTRRLEALENMRKIVDPNTIIDETNKFEPYSAIALKTQFDEADAVIYADVKSLTPDKDDEIGSYPFILQVEIKEVFKGNLKKGQTFEYKEDLLYRPLRDEDLGEQVIFLEKVQEDGKVFYRRINRESGDIRHNVLEKLRNIAKEFKQ